jgi:hypothetical protein
MILSGETPITGMLRLRQLLAAGKARLQPARGNIPLGKR